MSDTLLPFIIISGPSGAGEDSVINGLRQKLSVEVAITTVTRSPRPGESEGHPYYFVTEPAFVAGVAAGEFFEYAQHYNGNWYGLSQAEMERIKQSGKIGIFKIDYHGVASMKRKLPGLKAIFLTAPLDVLEKRIRRRSEVTDAYVQERMAYTKEWLKHTDLYDYQVVNEEGKLEQTIIQVENIIRLEMGLDK
ncbi:MAG TPA: hypothetical protein VJB37_02580 [Patescibacteria group bacterium]|nr:hypothetical protein [Patescibacteria group bacterium]